MSSDHQTVRWGIAAACTVLLLKADAGARKQFFVAILALEAPADVVAGVKGENGLWVACLCLAMKIIYSFPFQLDFPLTVYLFLATLPASAVAVRGTLGGTTMSMVVAFICAYQYFTAVPGGWTRAFGRERLVNSVCISFITVASVAFFTMQAKAHVDRGLRVHNINYQLYLSPIVEDKIRKKREEDKGPT